MQELFDSSPVSASDRLPESSSTRSYFLVIGMDGGPKHGRATWTNIHMSDIDDVTLCGTNTAWTKLRCGRWSETRTKLQTGGKEVKDA